MRARISTPLDREMRHQGRQAQWLAAAVGVHESQISRWRSGMHVPEKATQRKIAKALGRTTDDLWPEPEREVA